MNSDYTQLNLASRLPHPARPRHIVKIDEHDVIGAILRYAHIYVDYSIIINWLNDGCIKSTWIYYFCWYKILQVIRHYAEHHFDSCAVSYTVYHSTSNCLLAGESIAQIFSHWHEYSIHNSVRLKTHHLLLKRTCQSMHNIIPLNINVKNGVPNYHASSATSRIALPLYKLIQSTVTYSWQ